MAETGRHCSICNLPSSIRNLFPDRPLTGTIGILWDDFKTAVAGRPSICYDMSASQLFMAGGSWLKEQCGDRGAVVCIIA
jgi:hypothetical protein